MFNKIYISPFQISPSQWSRNRPQSLRGAYSFWFFFASYLHWFASLWFPGWPAHFLVCWRKLSILIRHRLNSMVWNFASWHKLSILFRLLSNPMGLDEFVFANFPSFSGIGWIRWAEILLPDTNSTSISGFGWIRWAGKACSGTNSTSLLGVCRIRWRPQAQVPN